MFKYLLIAALVLPSLCLVGVTELTDANFDAEVRSDSAIWVVLFAADWCGHCQHLKPEFENVAPKLNALGVKVGHVNDKNSRLVNDYVVDHDTHMVSYPKMFVFLGSEKLAEVPSGIRNADSLYNWVKNEYSLSEPQAAGEEEL